MTDGRWLPIGTEYSVRNDAVEVTVTDQGDGRMQIRVEGRDGRFLRHAVEDIAGDLIVDITPETEPAEAVG